MVRIALDAMGTDQHPYAEVHGAVEALRDLTTELELILVGDQGRIEAELARVGDLPAGRLSVVHTTQRIEQGEAPATAVRRKPDSSIVRGLRLQQEGLADAFVSAGSTGAVMAASHFILRPLPGVDRPAIATVLPAREQPVVLLDAGANVDSRPGHLLQFARLGSIFARDVLQRAEPRIGLLNIGEEPEKGNELAVETYRLLSESDLNFVGNVEGRDIIRGVCDVVVTDGFVGNVLLKFYESVSGFISDLIKRELATTHPDLDLSPALRALDYTGYGGAPLLGVNGISMICHGGSPPRAIHNAIRAAAQAVETDMVGDIQRAVNAAGTPPGVGQSSEDE